MLSKWLMNKHEPSWGGNGVGVGWEEAQFVCVVRMYSEGAYRGQEGSLSSQQGCISFNWSTCGTITSFTQTRYWWQKKTALSPLLLGAGFLAAARVGIKRKLSPAPAAAAHWVRPLMYVPVNPPRLQNWNLPEFSLVQNDWPLHACAALTVASTLQCPLNPGHSDEASHMLHPERAVVLWPLLWFKGRESPNWFNSFS